jgi:hypothetical protein
MFLENEFRKIFKIKKKKPLLDKSSLLVDK